VKDVQGCSTQTQAARCMSIFWQAGQRESRDNHAEAMAAYQVSAAVQGTVRQGATRSHCKGAVHSVLVRLLTQGCCCWRQLTAAAAAVSSFSAPHCACHPQHPPCVCHRQPAQRTHIGTKHSTLGRCAWGSAARHYKSTKPCIQDKCATCGCCIALFID
jgi:hypothetical protein